MDLPLTIEVTYSTAAAGSNKTQKINMNPFDWVAWTSHRNLLSSYLEVFRSFYKTPWMVMEDLEKECRFFGGKGRPSFANSNQPKEINNGEIEEYIYRYISTFIDDDGNIVYNNGISLECFDRVRDGGFSDKQHRINLLSQWKKMNQQYLQNPKDYDDSLNEIRNHFFSILDSIDAHASASNGLVKMINKIYADVSDEWRNLGSDKKAPKNIEDQRLVKTENTLFVLKNITCLYNSYAESKGLTYDSITIDYFQTLKKVLDKNVKKDMDATMRHGSGSSSRHPFLSSYHLDTYKELVGNYKKVKKETDAALRALQDKFFGEAISNAFKKRTPSFTGYYYNPKTRKIMDRYNTDLGHDLLKAEGREANMETTFIQCLVENRSHKGTFGKPQQYYEDMIEAINNQLKKDIETDTENEDSTLLMESKIILKEVVKLYKKGFHKELDKKG
jgi:hypothetical protein